MRRELYMDKQDFKNQWALTIWNHIEEKVINEMKGDKNWLNATFRDGKKTIREAGAKKLGRGAASFAASHIPIIGPLLGKAINLIPADEVNDGRQLQMASYYAGRAVESLQSYHNRSKSGPGVHKDFKEKSDSEKLDEYKNTLINIMRSTVEISSAKMKIEELEQSSKDSLSNLVNVMEKECTENMRKLIPTIEIELQDLSIGKQTIQESRVNEQARPKVEIELQNFQKK